MVKRGLKKNATGSLSSRLAKSLLSYCTMPHTTTGVTPAEPMIGQRPRIRLDLLKPNVARDVRISQTQSKLHYDSSNRNKTVDVGDKVFVKNFGRGQRWLPGTVTKTERSVVLEIRLDNGQFVRRHKDHVKSRVLESSESAMVPYPAVEAASVPVSSDTITESRDTTIESDTTNEDRQTVSNRTAVAPEQFSQSHESNVRTRLVRNCNPTV